MFRKTALGIAAALVLLAPSVALAGKHGGHHGHHHGHHHHGHHHHGHHHHGHHHHGHRHVRYFYAGGGCYQYRWVETRYGLAKRLVNVCAY
jgi:hypothetical protein